MTFPKWREKMYGFKILDSHDDGREKVVEVVASVQGADGPTEVHITYTWTEHERYKVDSGGKLIPKTGTDYKQEITDALDRTYSPKESSPSPSETT